VILQPGMMRGRAHRGGEPAGRIRGQVFRITGDRQYPPGWRPNSRNFSANQKNRMIPAGPGMQDEHAGGTFREKKIT